MDRSPGKQTSTAPRSSDETASRTKGRETEFPVYENLLKLDPRWALGEGSRHFEEKSAVVDALGKITRRLDELDVPYAVIGAMAMFEHGLRRFTEDVDILVTKEGLKKIHDRLEGLGYRPPHKYSKHLRDTELGVRVEFLTTGEYPGDGKKKPVAFPDPSSVSFKSRGISYIKLENLIELKLASGMTNPGRLKDLADVLELTKLLNLPVDFSQKLDPYVREKYGELWGQGRMRYITLWRNKRLASDVKTIGDMIADLGDAAGALEAMRQDGIVLERGGVGDDYAHLVTTDPTVAKKYDMVEESEFWGESEKEDADDGGKA